ncbi:MAG: aminotransferase family protein [Promethearchaeota archaeon]|jgi:adenosylmethionine-8-amino-7-oxononanoate aminotransferase
MTVKNTYPLWHPFTNMRPPFHPPIRFVEGYGIWLVDSNGNRYINAVSSLMNVNLGLNRKEIVDAITHQASKLAYMTIERGLVHDPAIELSRKLHEITPLGLDRVFLTTTGAEATETVLKIVRQFAKLTGRQEKYRFISLEKGYHGASLAALSITGMPELRAPFEPLLTGCSFIPAPYCYRCEFGKTYPACELECAKALERAIQSIAEGFVGGFIIEPVMGVGGVIIPPEGYLRTIEGICKKYEVFLIFDEIITGFGRLGSMFGADYFQITPDMMILSKGINSGYLPISATILNEKIYQTFWREVESSDEMTFSHGSTMTGNPICCASALATIKIIEEEDLVQNAKVVGQYLLEHLMTLSRYSFVGEIRGLGLLLALELVEDKNTRVGLSNENTFGIVARLYQSGLCVHQHGNVIILGPPLICTKEDADNIFKIIVKTFDRWEKILN